MIIVINAAGSTELIHSILSDVAPPSVIKSVRLAYARDYLAGKGVYAERELPTMIMVDLNMKPPLGRDLVRWIRDAAYLSGIPVVGYGYSWMADELEAVKDLAHVRTVELPRAFEDVRQVMLEAMTPYLETV